MKFLGQGIFLGGFIFILLLSHSQSFLQFRWVVPLTGAFERSELVFSQDNFASFQFQEALERETSRHWGLQPLWVRMLQQLRFDIFGLTNDENVKGQNGILFGKAETQVATGATIAENEISQAIQKIKMLQSFLQQQNIPLVVILAPNKSRYFQRHLPANTCTVRYLETPYESIRYHLEKNQVPFWDATAYFQAHQEGQPYLMPPLGIHWSLLGAQKSIAAFMAQIDSWQIEPLGTLKIGACEFSSIARFTDNDMLDALNLVIPPISPPLCYPRTQWVARHSKPKVTVFGDSMYLTFWDSGLHRELFSADSLFVFYNRSILQEGVAERMPAHFMNLTEELLSSKMVLFMATEVNFHLIDFGVPEQLFHDLEIRLQNGF